MPRGQPDFGMYAVKEVSASISDMGEVAARLGSIVTYDKRGDVVYIDAFEEPVLKWSIDADEPLSYARLDSSNVRSGSQAVKLHTQDLDDDYVEMRGFFAPLASKRLGAEFSFSRLTINHELELRFDIYTGTHLKQPAIHLSYPDNKLYVLDENYEDLEVAVTPGYTGRPHLFFTTKVVFDLDLDKYVRLMLNTREYDISAVSFRSTVFPATPRVEFYVYVENSAALGGDLWVDDFILTQEEP